MRVLFWLTVGGEASSGHKRSFKEVWGGVMWLLAGSPENLARTVGRSSGRSLALCMHVGSLTGRGRGLLGADYSHEMDNGAAVSVY